MAKTFQIIRLWSQWLFLDHQALTLPNSRLLIQSDLQYFMRQLFPDVCILPVFYMEEHLQRWPSEPRFEWKEWLTHINMAALTQEVAIERLRYKSDVLIMDQVYNQYTKWRMEKELTLMESLL